MEDIDKYMTEEQLNAWLDRLAAGDVLPKRTSKQQVHAVFQMLGGEVGMALWAQKNPEEFYKIWAKTISTQVEITSTKTKEQMTDEELMGIINERSRLNGPAVRH